MSELSITEILTWPEMEDVRKELEDPRYANRKHGSRATKALRCDGPLCRLAERLRARKRNEERAKNAGRPYEPSPHRKYDRDDLLLAIIEWHGADLLQRRKTAS